MVNSDGGDIMRAVIVEEILAVNEAAKALLYAREQMETMSATMKKRGELPSAKRLEKFREYMDIYIHNFAVLSLSEYSENPTVKVLLNAKQTTH